MSITRIKMCGTTNIEDALIAVDAGVDALGFIFVEKSPRYISPTDAKEIIKKIPPFVDIVGVFVNRELNEVEEIIEYCGLSYAQLHGNEDPKFCERVSRLAAPCKVIKAMRVGVDSKKTDFTPYNDHVRGFLLDTYVKGQEGGTGKVFDWQIIEKLDIQLPIILAGGLTPENGLQAVEAVKPFAVDVNSGVEISPGIKDHKKIKDFMTRITAS